MLAAKAFVLAVTLFIGGTTDGAAKNAAIGNMLRDRVAVGRPQQCIQLPQRPGGAVIPKVGIVYGGGRRVWLSRPTGNLENLDDKAILVSRRPSRRLCRSDEVDLVDRYSGVPLGFVILGEFTAYDRN